MNVFPRDYNTALTGFGGDPLKNREEHRRAIRKTPVILVHGNAGHSAHPKWGMQTMKAFLKELAQYEDSEIWAMDYLGENNSTVDLNNPHRNHIAQFKAFVDQVKDYLGVRRLDFIAHSLGCGMVNGYLRGLQSNGEWNNDDHRLDVVSTFVSLAGATYGLGLGGQSEFRTGSAFEVNSHKVNDVVDDSPDGANNTGAAGKLEESLVAGHQWNSLCSDNIGERFRRRSKSGYRATRRRQSQQEI
jgi:pimeloyl-ACP methyl ester carboxylesterase